MSLLKEKALHLVLALGLVLSIFVPSIAMAYETKGDTSSPSLTIHKFEQEPGTEKGEAGTGLPGQNAKGKAVKDVTFTLTMTHKYDADTDTWTEVKDGKTIEAITNDKGQAVFTKANGLELGRYKVQETKGPAHVILNTEVFSVDVPMTSKEGSELNYDVHIYPKNETIRGDIELTKVDEDGESLSGVTFGLFNEDGTKALDTEGNEISTLKTNKNGKIKVEGLAAGTYYFQELATLEGLALNDTKLAFEITKDASGQKIEVNWSPQDKYLTEDGKVTNYKLPDLEKDVEEKKHHDVDRGTEFNYNLTIKAPKDIEKYALLAVTDTLDNRLEYADNWSVVGTDASNIEFKQEGQKLVWAVKDLSLLTPGKDVKITFAAKIKKDV
ncbi:MAG: SpaA isopeptide-forming pilin-related protein [Vagococcus sp.]